MVLTTEYLLLIIIVYFVILSVRNVIKSIKEAIIAIGLLIFILLVLGLVTTSQLIGLIEYVFDGSQNQTKG